jgi:hypothetical protein
MVLQRPAKAWPEMVCGFDSHAIRLETFGRCGEIGKRASLRGWWGKPLAGSIPVICTSTGVVKLVRHIRLKI